MVKISPRASRRQFVHYSIGHMYTSESPPLPPNARHCPASTHLINIALGTRIPPPPHHRSKKERSQSLHVRPNQGKPGRAQTQQNMTRSFCASSESVDCRVIARMYQKAQTDTYTTLNSMDDQATPHRRPTSSPRIPRSNAADDVMLLLIDVLRCDALLVHESVVKV